MYNIRAVLDEVPWTVLSTSELSGRLTTLQPRPALDEIWWSWLSRCVPHTEVYMSQFLHTRCDLCDLQTKQHRPFIHSTQWPYLSTLVLPVTSTLGGPYTPLLSVHCCLADSIPRRIHLADVFHYCVSPCNPRSSSFQLVFNVVLA